MQSVMPFPASKRTFRTVYADAAPSRATNRQVNRANMINASLFNGALIRERRRADRSARPLALLLVEPVGGAAISEGIWQIAIETLSTVKRDIDMLGWFSDRKVLGVLMPEIGGVEGIAERSIQSNVKRELARRLSQSLIDQFSIRLHVHTPVPIPETGERSNLLDPLIASLRSVDHGVKSYETRKRAMDIAGSFVLLAVLAPVLLVVAALVKITSRGPVFFRQPRIGRGGQRFTMLKFRTMYTGVDNAIHQEFITQFIKAGAQPLTESKDSPFKLTQDPRITPLGGFLRRTSLDELPQLLNVLRGDMSLVGPRPPLRIRGRTVRAVALPPRARSEARALPACGR